jgi:hypothetical protein
MTRSRGSRFTGSDYVPGVPSPDEKKTPDQRERERQTLIEAEGRLGPSFWQRRFHEKLGDDEFDQALTEEGLAHQEASELTGVAGLGKAHTDSVASIEQKAGGWRVRWVLAKRDGAYVVRSVRVEPESPSTPAGGITTNLLRELSPASAVKLAQEGWEKARRPLEPFEEVGFGVAFLEEFVRRMGPALDEKPTRGRPRTSDHRLAEVALAYLDELPRGTGLTQRIADRFTAQDGHRVDPSTVRDWVRRARDEGFLTRADGQMGRRGATPGPRFAELIDSQKGDMK